MAEAYYNDYREPERKPRGGLLRRLFDLVITLLSIGAAAGMVMLFLIPHIHPAKFQALSVLGLVSPVIYVATVLFALYWVIRWRPVRALLMLALVVAGLFKVSLYYKPELRRIHAEEGSERGTITLMSWNVRGFQCDDFRRSSADSAARIIEAWNPDIVCLQEYAAAPAARSSAFSGLAERYESARFGYGSRDSEALSNVQMAILSKYRILRSGVVTNPAVTVWADLAVGDDTVRIFSNHLWSTRIKAADNDYLASRQFISDTAREEKIRDMLGRFTANTVQRAAQVDSLRLVFGDAPACRIVCGDFNDTPMSYAYSRLSEGLNDAFRESGSGYSHTYRGFFNMLRIDYVLSADCFETLSYEVPDVGESDHLPVVVRLKRRKN